METEQLGRLQDILNAAQLISSYVQGVSEAEFIDNFEKQDAVIRRIEVIGEATAHLNDETRSAIPDLPFRKMRGMRNIVAHDYANVNLKVVWEVATVHIPDVCQLLEKFFAELKSSWTRSAQGETSHFAAANARNAKSVSSRLRTPSRQEPQTVSRNEPDGLRQSEGKIQHRLGR